MVDTLHQSDQDNDVSNANLSTRRRVWLLTVASTDVLLVITSMVALNAALPDLAVETSATQGQLTWVVDGYTLVLACLLLPAGAIGDRYGRRGALLIGLAIFGLASIAPVILDSPTQIIIARAVAGDDECRRVIADAGHRLGVAAAGMCNLVDPEVLVIGGDLADAGELLLGPIREVVARRATPSTAGAVPVVSAELGAAAGVRGALVIALERVTIGAPGKVLA